MAITAKKRKEILFIVLDYYNAGDMARLPPSNSELLNFNAEEQAFYNQKVEEYAKKAIPWNKNPKKRKFLHLAVKGAKRKCRASELVYRASGEAVPEDVKYDEETMITLRKYKRKQPVNAITGEELPRDTPIDGVNVITYANPLML